MRGGAKATEVEVAIEVEEIRAVDIKNSNYKICMNVGYLWEGHDDWDFSDTSFVHFYKGDTTAATVNIDKRGEGGKNYQLVYYEVTISKNYWTHRFPLESHQLRFFIVPSNNIAQIKFKVDSLSLLPDALQTGLVEYVNIFGIAIIILIALTIIRINNFRNERGKAIYAKFYGHTMFWTFVVIVLVGNIVLPMAARRYI